MSLGILRLRRRGARTPQKAVVLILTLWIVVVLSVIASSLAFDVQVNSKLALLQKEQFIAYNLARSAVAVGMTHLQNDMLIDFEGKLKIDAYSDVWAQPDRREKDIEVELGKGTYELQIHDENGKININGANQRLLKAMLEYYGMEEPDSDDTARAIIDWRDQDDVATEGNNEKENERYSGLMGQKVRANTEAEELIYQCSNEPFITINQLLDVYGITPEIFYGYDPDTEEAREQKMREDIAMGKKSRREPRKRKKDQRLALKDIITVRGDNRVNLNTASEEVLTILMYAGSNCANMETAQAAAESIVDFRGGGRKGRAPDPDDAFRSLSDVAKVPGVNAAAIAQIGQSGLQVGFFSEIYSVVGIGRMGNVQKTLTAIVQRHLDEYNPDDARLVANKRSGTLHGSFKSRGGTRKSGGSKSDDNIIRVPAVRVLEWIE